MSFENMQLPTFLIADLYKNSLVEFDNDIAKSKHTTKQKAAEEILVHQTKTLQYLGENRRGIVIVVNQPDVSIIEDDNLAFLTNILKACNLNLSDIAIVNNHKQEVVFTIAREQLDSKTILIFDVSPSSIKLPFSIPDFQVHQYSGCTILTVPSLSELNQATEDSRLKKSKLWTSLKQVFNI